MMVPLRNVALRSERVVVPIATVLARGLVTRQYKAKLVGQGQSDGHKPLIHTMQGMSMLTLKEFNEQQIEELLWTALDMKAIAKRSSDGQELGNLLTGKL